MNDGITRIQRRSASLPLLAILSLLMTGASIFCIIFPYIKKFDDVLFYAFLAVGGIGLLYFSYMLASSIYGIFIPQNAMSSTKTASADYHGLPARHGLCAVVERREHQGLRARRTSCCSA